MPPSQTEPHDASHGSLRWSEVSREMVYRCPLFDVYRTGRRPDGPGASASDFYVLDAHDWVTVVPVLDPGGPDESFLMVRQYRHGLEHITLEFPAGLVERGEAPEVAARRELREETGHEAAAVVHAATMGAAPAFMNNRCHVYIAWGLERTRAQELDAGERIDLVTMPSARLAREMGTGELINTVTATAHYFFLRWSR